MRLFIAIDFKEQEKYFKELQKQIPKDPIAKIKPVSAFHLTLKFLGDIKKPNLEKIKQELSKIKLKPFKTTLSNLGVFPSNAFIKVVWVGFKQNKELIQLQKQVEKVLEKFHFKRDFKFVPHLTLARINFIKDKPKFLKKLDKIKTKEQEVEITNFKLIKSVLTKEGPVYTDLEVFK